MFRDNIFVSQAALAWNVRLQVELSQVSFKL